MKFLQPLSGLLEHIRRLSVGDRTIVYTLSTLLGFFLIIGFFSTLEHFMVEVPRRGGSISEGILGSPRFVNPVLAITDADRDVTTLTHAGLMGLTGSGEVVPVLAESYTVSEDEKTYTFILREKLTWSDGAPITADDIVFTVMKIQDPSSKSPELANWANIRVEALDARTVVFTLPKPYAPFLSDATLGIMPAHIWKDVGNEEFAFSPYMSKPVSAGPFIVEKVTRDAKGIITSMSLKGNSRYALGRPYLERMHLRFYAQDEDLNQALSSGAVDTAYGAIGKTATTSPYSRVFGVFFNANVNQLFTDETVRKALSVALERNELIQNALGGFATPIFGPVPPSENLTLTTPEEEFGSLSSAQALLEADGWTRGDNGIYTHKKKGDLAFTIKTSNAPELKLLASEIKRQWELLGARVSIELYESGDLTQSVIRPRAYEALLFGMVVDRELDLYAFWNSSERNDPGLNIAMYANADVDELLTNIREEQDPTKKDALLEKLNSTIGGEYPAAFTHVPDFVYTIAKELKGVSLPHIATPADRFASVASWYTKTEKVWPIFRGSR